MPPADALPSAPGPTLTQGHVPAARDAPVTSDPLPSEPLSIDPVPADPVLADPARLTAVSRLAGATGSRSGLDRLTRLAALLLDAPKAQVSLTGEHQLVVSLHGALLTAENDHGPVGDSLCTVTVLAGRQLEVTDALVDDRVSHLPPVTGGGVRSYLGAPLRDSGGRLLGAFCVYDDHERSWSPHQVALLGELAESVVAELELRALGEEASAAAARLSTVLEAADVGIFELDIATGALHWDDHLLALFGYERDAFPGDLASFRARVHPQDLDRVGSALTAAVASSGELSSQYRIVLGNGQVRWIETRGRVVDGGPTGGARLLGVAYDTTELREARDRVARVLETMNEGFLAVDGDWSFSYVNRQAERLLGRPREQLLGRVLWDAFPAARGSVFQERYEHAVATGEPVVFETTFVPQGDRYEVSAWPGPDGLSVYFRDVSVRRRAEREREQAILERERAYAAAEAANARLALLADASTRLAASLEPRQVLERLSDVVVPALGRWVAVGLTSETAALLRGHDPADPARVHVVHVAHSDPAQYPRLTQLSDALALSTSDAAGMGAAVRTGQPQWGPGVPAAAPGGAAADLAAEIGSALTVPLVNRDLVLGAMTVAPPAVGAVDRALLVDLAGRAAVALDNALLYRAERRTGLTLQRSLLPRELPAVPGLASAARYLPGTTGAFVGGDWYQGVRVGRGLVLAMGDVMGHGMRSAARMGQLRAIVATLALEGHGPAALLRRLADHVDVLLDLDLATLLVAAYDPQESTLTVASAGHPPPLLAPSAGAPHYLAVDPGPPLGSFPFPYEQVVVDLSAGDTLVLYTDGLVENRDESLDVGLERLRVALTDVRLPPEQLCDSVLERLGRSAGGDDDVALLVLTHLPAGDAAGDV